MRYTSITIRRPEKTTLTGLDGRLASGIRVKVDEVSEMLQANHQAYDYHAPYTYKVYTFGWYPNSLIRKGDVLIDERYTDPQTGQLYKYRVTGRPKDFQGDHQECQVEVVEGQ